MRCHHCLFKLNPEEAVPAGRAVIAAVRLLIELQLHFRLRRKRVFILGAEKKMSCVEDIDGIVGYNIDQIQT